MDNVSDPPLRIAVVGPCSAGKSSLTPVLREAGFAARHPAQEHSCAPNMWQRMSNPDILIYLDLSYEQARIRRPHIDGGRRRLQEQHDRLAHARKHCDYYLDTSDLSQQEVQDAVFAFLKEFLAQRNVAFV